MTIEALNAVCPYYTMYPLQFPLNVLKRGGARGDVVLDPFCGRGTTNFAARLLGMPSYGIDSSPVAAALASAKLVYATPGRVVAAAQTMLSGHPTAEMPSGEFWTWAYHPETLAELCRLRAGLLESCDSPSRILLRAILLGALHGPQPKGAPSYLSNQSPRTFAPKPRYAVKFWRERGLHPQKVDVLRLIGTKAERYLSARLPDVEGAAVIADSRVPKTFDSIPTARWIITSPPYYGMRTYIPDQWLRSWFLGAPEHVEYRPPATEVEHTGVDHFARQLGLVWKNTARRSTTKTRLVIRFGGIHDRNAEPMDVLRQSFAGTDWRISTARTVPDADTGRRQVRQFQSKPKKSITEYDVYCTLS